MLHLNYLDSNKFQLAPDVTSNICQEYESTSE